MPIHALPGRGAFLLLPFGLAGCVEGAPAGGSAATPWPAFQAGLRPGRSASPVLARLPAGIAIQPAPPGVPEVRRAALGRWQGWIGANGVGSVAIVIDRVEAQGGSGLHAHADARTPSSTSGWAFRLVDGNGLRGQLPTGGAIVTLRPRPDGAMDILFERGRGWSAGVLSRDA